MVLCRDCGLQNPDDNLFCGRCGSRLGAADSRPAMAGYRRPEHVAESQEPIADSRQPTTSAISGPSFLGLAEAPAEGRSLDYLYEDEPRHYGRWLFALLLLVGVGAFLWAQWKQPPAWQTAIKKLRSVLPSQQAQPSPAQAMAAETPAAGSQNGASQPNSADPANGPEAAQGGNAIAANQDGTGGPGGATNSGAAEAADGNESNDAGAARRSAGEDAPEHPSLRSGQASATANEATTKEETETAELDQPAPRPAKRKPDVRVTADPLQLEAAQLLAKGQAYLYGQGARQNCPLALMSLRRAADLGNAKANSQLGGMYATGHCVPLDRARAYEWFTKARDAGERSPWIQRNREMLWSQMTAAEKQQALKAHAY